MLVAPDAFHQLRKLIPRTVHPTLRIDAEEEPMDGNGLQQLRLQLVSVPIVGVPSFQVMSTPSRW